MIAIKPGFGIFIIGEGLETFVREEDIVTPFPYLACEMQVV